MHVLITGASSGIGEAIAGEYLTRGASLTVVARRRDRLEALAGRAGDGRVHVIARDLSEHDGVPEVVAEAEAALGPIDVLVNNAGVQILGPAHQAAWAPGEQLLKVNVLAPLRMTLAVLPGMVARGAGTIVDVASMAALAPTPGMFFYNASKGALAAASEGLRAEVAPHGVHVVTVYPGPVRSDMETAAREAFQRSGTLSRVPTGTADELARLIADAVTHRRPRVIYPRFYALSRHLPAATRWLVDTFTPPLKDA
ncbi:MAG: SDR family NAD(P)-dependent oxidoreductase [Myxococcales bacterium]|nr:SDR family NAD(P)-dependent oxidoreductase [Myxococcales bacterium]